MLKSLHFASALLVALAGLAIHAYAIPPSYETTLPNGLHVIMIPDSRVEMAVSYVVINAGVRHETPDINGVTHFLEHMLFNGTDSRTQEQIYAEADFLGAFNNAFTRKDFTAFMILAPSHTFPEAFALQADMVLHSTLPPEKLEKERGIIIEEINQGLSNPEELVGQAWNRLLWRGTPYETTVLGPKALIASIPREKVLDYYRSHYAPNSITLLLIGDFDPQEMLEQVNAQYGDALPQQVPSPDITVTPQPGIHTQYFEGISPSVRFAIPLNEPPLLFGIPRGQRSDIQIAYPGYSSRKPLEPEKAKEFILDGVPLARLAKRPPEPDRSILRMFAVPLMEERLKQRLEEIAGKEVDLSLSEESYADGGYITGTVRAEDAADARTLAAKINDLLPDLVDEFPDEEWLERKRRQLLADELKQYDNFLYYGMFKSYLIARGDWRLARGFEDELEKVGPGDVYQEMVRILVRGRFTTLIALPYPETDAALKSVAATRRVVLDNGVTLLLKSDSRSEVFGATVLFRNRSFAEPAGKCGIAELWQRVLSRGPAGMGYGEFEERMETLGLSLQFVDNPYIPMDDMYLSPRYSFIKAEGLDENWRQNLELIADVLSNPQLTDEALGEAKKSLAQVLGMKSASTRAQARLAMYGALFGDHPLAKPIEGAMPEVMRVSVDDLQEFAKTYCAGGNIIVSIVSAAPDYQIEQLARELFAGLPAGGAIAAQAPTVLEPAGIEEGEGAPQAGVYFGYAFEGFDETDLAALTVLGGIVSDRMAFVIREEHGLAYSIGAGFSSFEDIGWFSLAMGTAPENVPQAQELIRATLTALETAGITRDSIAAFVNSYVGRRAMRRITRKNQSFFAAKAELLGIDDAAFDRALRSVTVTDVERVRERYFHPETGTFFVVK